MDEKTKPGITDKPPGWALPLLLFGVALAVVSIIGLIALPAGSEAGSSDPGAPTRTAAPFGGILIRPTRDKSAEKVQDNDSSSTSTPESEPIITATFPPRTPIAWTEGEKNALSWLCYYEVRGMGNVRVDACLSVISTVRARYAYANGFAATDVISTLSQPNQFNIEFSTTEPAPDAELYGIVEQYQYGLRGSCNGYLYFDSVAGGPSLCVIRSSNGQWLEFHNGWN